MEESHDVLNTVKRATDALAELRGSTMNAHLRGMLADLVAIEFPEIARAKVEHRLVHRLRDGSTLDEPAIAQLANEIAMLKEFPVYVGIDLGYPGSDHEAYTLIGPAGQRATVGSLHAALALADRWGVLS